MTSMQAAILTKQIKILSREVSFLRSFAIGTSLDPEGTYNSEFVHRVRQRASLDGKRQRFTNRDAFLAEINKI